MTAPFTLVTVATLGFLPRCDVLFQSLKRYHPEAHCLILLLDPLETELQPPPDFEIVSILALDLPDLEHRLFRTTAYERPSAVKALALKLGLERSDKVIFLDADIEIFSSFLPVLEALEKHSLVFTPHLTKPKLDHPWWRIVTKFGVLNGGFLAASRSAQTTDFLDWFDSKLEHHCYNDVAEGMFNDQRWLDFAPLLFPDSLISHHPGLNYAYWNFCERDLDGDIDNPTVNGEPLIFFHFSGWRLQKPHALTHYLGPHDFEPTPESLLGRLVHRYYQQTVDSPYFELSRKPSAFNFYHNGQPISPMDHIFYSEFLESKLPTDRDPFAGLPQTLALQMARFLGKANRLLGYGPTAQRQNVLYRYFRAILKLVGPYKRRARLTPER